MNWRRATAENDHDEIEGRVAARHATIIVTLIMIITARGGAHAGEAFLTIIATTTMTGGGEEGIQEDEGEIRLQEGLEDRPDVIMIHQVIKQKYDSHFIIIA